MGTHSDFLIGVESHADITMRNLLMVAQIAHGLHNLCDTRLVVGSQQCGAIGDNEVFAFVIQQFWEFGRAAHDAW